MKTLNAARKTRLNRLARKIGRMTARTEMTALETKGELEAKMKDFRARQKKALAKLTQLHVASNRALKEFKIGIRKAAAELDRVIHTSSSPSPLQVVKGTRATTRGRRRRR